MSDKVGLLEMILWAEQEAERVDIWKTVLNREGQDVDPRIARNGLIAGKIAETLSLLKTHEREFVAMVRAARESARRQQRAAGAAPRSTAPSSPPSTGASSDSESTEP